MEVAEETQHLSGEAHGPSGGQAAKEQREGLVGLQRGAGHCSEGLDPPM